MHGAVPLLQAPLGGFPKQSGLHTNTACFTGIVDGNADGLFGTAVATMGMLSTAAFILSMDMFGPIAGGPVAVQVGWQQCRRGLLNCRWAGRCG